MPELPEVETVRRGLVPHMEGQKLKGLEARRRDLRWPLPDDLEARLEGQTIGALGRRSKYLLMHFERGDTLIVHLGMSGRMTVQGDVLGNQHFKPPQREKHDHVIFTMGSGTEVIYNDPRRFGSMHLVRTEALADHPLITILGPEPLSNTFSGPYLEERLAGRKTQIKAALLDQRITSGLGNIYVCESLYRAHISPFRASGSLSTAECAALVSACRNVLNDAIAAGGSSLRDYRQAGGELGYFQHAFQVYDQEGKPCATPGCNGVIARETQSGRSSYFCTQCQS